MDLERTSGVDVRGAGMAVLAERGCLSQGRWQEGEGLGGRAVAESQKRVEQIGWKGDLASSWRGWNARLRIISGIINLILESGKCNQQLHKKWGSGRDRQ